jgi:multidrug transporter EmrE-like cation transporter
MRYFLALVAALILNATANLLIKASAVQPAADSGASAGLLPAVRGLATNIPFLIGLLCFGLNLVAYQYALQKLQISIAYPIMVTCGYVIIVVIAGWKMGERLVPVQWAGVILILIGVWLVSYYVKSDPTPTNPPAASSLRDAGTAAR